MQECGGRVNAHLAHRARFGKYGERLALLYYILHGYWPAPRARREYVQTDLLLQTRHVLVLVEVKTRRKMARLEEILHHIQRARLAKQVAFWAAKRPDMAVRLDVVLITPKWPFIKVWHSILS